MLRSDTDPFSLAQWIRKELKEIIPLSTAEMDKDGLSPSDLVAIMVHLWCKDHYEFRGDCPDRSRVQFSFAALLYCFTSARTGEVHESTARRKSARAAAACYKHFTLYLQRIDGEVILVMYYKREFIKGAWTKNQWELPIHGFYEKYKKDILLLLCPLLFFLPLAFADGAIRDYASIDELLNEADHAWPFTEHRTVASTGKARGADSFGKHFADAGHRAGFKSNVTVRACRRWALMEADKMYTEAAWMKFAGQTTRTMFGSNYAHPVCQVDGQATYLGIEPREDHIKHGCGLQLQRHSQLLQSLPARLEMEFHQRKDVIDLKKEMEVLSLQMITAHEDEKRRIQTESHKIYNQQKRLYNAELKSQREQQPWNKEMERHLIELESTNSRCKCSHPLCTAFFDNVEELRFHLQDVHCYRKINGKMSRKGDLSESETVSGKMIFTFKAGIDKMPDLKIVGEPSQPPSPKKPCIDPQLFEKPDKSQCPICSTSIEARLLREYMNEKKFIPFRAQMEICRAHKKMTAESQRRERGYPVINWDTIEDRLTRLGSMIHSIIRAKTKSFFETSIENNLQSLSRGSDFHCAGYYGPKGLEIIGQHIARVHCSHITAVSSTKLQFIRRCGGVPAYIQEVLVPEVLTKLIGKDMGMGDCQARSVLEGSKEIGELLNGFE
ncbi:hypothetical protein LOZ57_002325 [Ophidiomyces ophidiicola]|uniref:uncharacterized protein n=1 Tax=Ophidiomyces ophidiicola TaxID=1387563 RepID=UPI0020C3FA2D|nr:uncharacterized protein LOZ57_002325 [Ophidiomyces ophidiicola]KAI1949847.1 hypothetical protein LOZ57_002325 [Ophidiomyces ophidiicola]KAI2048870.1 hypothetical protein LOZ43_005283 [Ophidiomyces ophidiicola]